MAAKDTNAQKSTKRKDTEGSKRVDSKKPRLTSSTKPSFTDKQQVDTKHGKPKFEKSKSEVSTKDPQTKKELRIRAKELAEARKKKRKRHYSLEQELASLWEKMRRRDIAKEDRSKLISEAIQKMKGKTPEIAGSHVSSRVLQTCVKHCTQAERDAVFVELQPHLLTLACNTYAVHLLTKMLDNASKKQLAACISSLRGHVASLLRHTVGSVVIEHAYQLGNAMQKQELLVELYSTELQLFKDLVSMKEKRLVDVISKLSLQKGAVIRHMISLIQPILEKGIVDHSMTHKLLVEYLTIADKTSAADVLQQLSGPLLVRMIHTRDGAKLGMLCVKHGSAKDRKKIIKGMKGHVGKIAHDQCGSLVLASILSTVDDTKLVSKIVIRELQANLKEIVLDKNGRRPLLQLLHPNCSRYFSPDDLASFDLSVPSLCTKDTKASDTEESRDTEEKGEQETVPEQEEISDTEENTEKVEGGKKDPLVRRQELLVKSGLAESLIDVCLESAEEMLKSNLNKEVIYEVATGGSDGILHPDLDDKLNSLHESIASLVAKTESEEGEEHILVNFHSSRTIRKLILDCPTFASTFWKKALAGKCRSWAQGHSGKVISAFMESQNSEIVEMAKKELQTLIDDGSLKKPETKATSRS